MVRAARSSRGISQRELAELAGLPNTTVARIEAGHVDPKFGTFDRLMAAAGYGLALVDGLGRLLAPDENRDRLVDRAGRRLPAHLKAAEHPNSLDAPGRYWWGWYRVAWPLGDNHPAAVYWRRRRPPRPISDSKDPRKELGYLWDDAT